MTEIPFNSQIDDDTYVFRNQSIEALQHMQYNVGSNLAACRHATITYPHKEFKNRNASLQLGRSLYNLSVWRNENLARNALNTYVTPEKDFVLMRIPRNLIEKTSLICVDDDMLPDKAFLLFEEGDYVDGQVYGPTKLPWKQIEMTDPVWRPMKIDPTENLTAVEHALSDTYRQLHHFSSEVGLPAVDLILRGTLRQLCEAKQACASISRWHWRRLASATGTLNSLYAQWDGYCASRNPAIRAALQRLRNSAPENHPWMEWLDKQRP